MFERQNRNFPDSPRFERLNQVGNLAQFSFIDLWRALRPAEFWVHEPAPPAFRFVGNLPRDRIVKGFNNQRSVWVRQRSSCRPSELFSRFPTYTLLLNHPMSRPLASRTGWRRERDSNPRYPFEHNGFQDRRFQPLTHPSGLCVQQHTKHF